MTENKEDKSVTSYTGYSHEEGKKCRDADSPEKAVLGIQV